MGNLYLTWQQAEAESILRYTRPPRWRTRLKAIMMHYRAKRKEAK